LSEENSAGLGRDGAIFRLGIPVPELTQIEVEVNMCS
jgi:hypothetical protein